MLYINGDWDATNDLFGHGDKIDGISVHDTQGHILRCADAGLAKLDSTHSESDIKTVCQQLAPVVNGVNNYGNGLIRLNQLIGVGYTISYDANGGDNVIR